MINIRYNLFETNSSSVHTLVLCSEEDYDQFKNGQKLFDFFSDSLITMDEAIEHLKYSLGEEYIEELLLEEDKAEFLEILENEDMLLYEDYFDRIEDYNNFYSSCEAMLG
jgi:hypothetical protein